MILWVHLWFDFYTTNDAIESESSDFFFISINLLNLDLCVCVCTNRLACIVV